MLPDIEQFSGLLKSSVVLRTVVLIAWRGEVGMAQGLASVNARPCGLGDFAHGW